VSDISQLNDIELSAVFAVEVAGYPKIFLESSSINFATSMDAVLPYLERQRFLLSRQFAPVAYIVRVETRRVGYEQGYDKSFPRAACIALTLAARAEKEAGK
jgi:hypothetical protein